MPVPRGRATLVCRALPLRVLEAAPARHQHRLLLQHRAQHVVQPVHPPTQAQLQRSHGQGLHRGVGDHAAP
eukprot:CAMPEP_0196755494 /NCGR_PEP_ID=MMETSP1091-20130531/97733_1 /TAXON_ID=302021 /ORGANISM="Rhodomonas sp., Strain CCMP768" /LENGTH=70 /DNA_ID=CAMNT_0042103917 /DNA_START=179 /DNA_END=387 /DNA_ORIENTATION=+